MTLFLHHYGWTQVQDRSWNPLKTFKATQKGLRMIYDAHMEAIMNKATNRCVKWLLFNISC